MLRNGKGKMSLCREIGIRDRRVILEREREVLCEVIISLRRDSLEMCFLFFKFFFCFGLAFFFYPAVKFGGLGSFCGGQWGLRSQDLSISKS